MQKPQKYATRISKRVWGPSSILQFKMHMYTLSIATCAYRRINLGWCLLEESSRVKGSSTPTYLPLEQLKTCESDKKHIWGVNISLSSGEYGWEATETIYIIYHESTINAETFLVFLEWRRDTVELIGISPSANKMQMLLNTYTSATFSHEIWSVFSKE